MSHTGATRAVARLLAAVGVLSLGFAVLQCAATGDAAARARSAAAWPTVYQVLQHPRCVNCHPAGAVPRQGDERRPHGQNVQGGPDGQGLYAMRCANCHLDHNAPGPHMPPGAPNWHLPHPQMPMVFEGRSATELARQLADPTQNGGRTPAQLLQHVTDDPLVLWGWNPGEGRTPVSIPHAEFVAAMRAWIEGGCALPE